jgi:hypothetical protein
MAWFVQLDFDPRLLVTHSMMPAWRIALFYSISLARNKELDSDLCARVMGEDFDVPHTLYHAATANLCRLDS